MLCGRDDTSDPSAVSLRAARRALDVPARLSDLAISLACQYSAGCAETGQEGAAPGVSAQSVLNRLGRVTHPGLRRTLTGHVPIKDVQRVLSESRLGQA